MKISYKFSLFDVDVGSVVDEEVFNTAIIITKIEEND